MTETKKPANSQPITYTGGIVTDASGRKLRPEDFKRSTGVHNG